MHPPPTPRFSNLLYAVNIKAPADDSIVPNSRITLPKDGLLIAFAVRDDVNYYYLEKDDVWTHYSTSKGSVHTKFAFHAPRELLAQSRSSSHISYMLEKAEIPAAQKPPMVSDIQQSIISLVNDPAYAPPRIMPILVEITVSACRDISPYIGLSSNMDQEEIYTGLNLDEGEEPTTTPAAKIAIEFLEKVKLGAIDDEQEGICAVCFEDFLEGVEVIYMPCKHAFHGDCIKKWLETSSVCPLCRFEMPSDDASCNE